MGGTLAACLSGGGAWSQEETSLKLSPWGERRALLVGLTQASSQARVLRVTGPRRQSESQSQRNKERNSQRERDRDREAVAGPLGSA